MAPQARRTHGANDDGYASTDRAALAATALEVTRRLVALYGEPAWSAEGPLGVLIGTILSQRTRDAQTGAAYAALKRRFPSWETMRDAPLVEVQKAIANVNWPELKAPRLQQIARQVTAERGALNLDFLCDLPAEDALAWLLKLTGVGPKTAACTLLFACRKPVLPVDVHVHRVSIRLGLIAPKVTEEAAHDLLQALLPPDARIVYDYHNSLLLHGQRVCVGGRPRCDRCALTSLCAYYRANVEDQAKSETVEHGTC